VFVSSANADDTSATIVPVPTTDIAARLARDQPYASGQPGWQPFLQRLSPLGVFELRRGAHPRASVDALLTLLD
jgi:hypothetical protein